MKRFILALVAVVLGLSSCSKEDMLIGDWKFDSVSANQNGVQMTVSADQAGIDVVFSFKKNGKVETIIKGESEGEATYKISGDTLTLTYEGETMSFKCSVTNDTLVLTGRMDILEGMEGREATLRFKKI